MKKILNKESRAAIELMIANNLITKDVAEKYFPELAESEDERIRKEIIDYFYHHDTLPKWSIWIDWLEKQGEHNMGISEATKQELEDNLHKALEKETTESCNKFLEKQGEQKIDPDTLIQQRVDALADIVAEQKPADKIEPKFKVSDWVVYEEYIYQIHNISLKKYYECLRIDGTVHTFDFEYIDSKSRLWTIQDAKDGDVLSSGSNNPFIFNGFLANNVVGAYCGINMGGNFYIPIFNNNWTVLPVFPATKEQRELLLQKMKEAGYEWNAENKQLRKIKQKSAWSEEDEVKINRIVACLENLNVADNDILLKDVDWLKSIKDRVQPQPKQEWSEEDEKYIKDLTDYFTGGMSLKHTEEDIIAWIKSFRPQNRWKPSEEQMETLEHFVRSIGESGFASPYEGNTNLVYSLLSELKRLREE